MITERSCGHNVDDDTAHTASKNHKSATKLIRPNSEALDLEIVIATASDQVGEGRESMPVPYAGEVLEIGFNADFLREGVEGIEGDDVRLGLISPLRPGLLRGESDDHRYLLMPIRLPG